MEVHTGPSKSVRPVALSKSVSQMEVTMQPIPVKYTQKSVSPLDVTYMRD